MEIIVRVISVPFNINCSICSSTLFSPMLFIFRYLVILSCQFTFENKRPSQLIQVASVGIFCFFQTGVSLTGSTESCSVHMGKLFHGQLHISSYQ